MTIQPLQAASIEEATALALAEYQAEARAVPPLASDGAEAALIHSMRKLWQKGVGVSLTDDTGRLAGYLGFGSIGETERPDTRVAYAPLHGCAIRQGADCAKLASMLFEHASLAVRPQSAFRFEIKRWAHDTDTLRAFVLNQFGVLCAERVREAAAPVPGARKAQGVTMTELSKADQALRRDELVALWRALADHLRRSPCYYPGEEFTDDVFLEYTAEPNTRMFAALADGRAVGMIDACPGGGCFALDGACNIGDVYALPAYRGQGVARALLQFACDQLAASGYRRLWVEHGTVNPTALRFWGAAFEPFGYTLTREIDRRAHG